MSGMRGPYSTPRTWYTPVDPGPPSVGSVSCPRLGEESVSLCDRNIARSRCATANSSSDGNPCNERREADPNGRLPCVKDLCSTPRQVHSQCTYVRGAKSMQRTCWRFSRGGEYAPGPRSPVELSCLTNRLAALVSAWQGVVTALLRTRVCVCVCAVVCVGVLVCVAACVRICTYPNPAPRLLRCWLLRWRGTAGFRLLTAAAYVPANADPHVNASTPTAPTRAGGSTWPRAVLSSRSPYQPPCRFAAHGRRHCAGQKAHSRPMISSTVCPSSVIFADLPS